MDQYGILESQRCLENSLKMKMIMIMNRFSVVFNSIVDNVSCILIIDKHSTYLKKLIVCERTSHLSGALPFIMLKIQSVTL